MNDDVEMETREYNPKPNRPCKLRTDAIKCAEAWATGRCQAARRGISCQRYHELYFLVRREEGC